MTLVLTGEGESKSCSAFRAAGWDMQALVIQFFKGKWKSGEQQAASRFENMTKDLDDDHHCAHPPCRGLRKTGSCYRRHVWYKHRGSLDRS
ncbi:MAG: cob(I)yrinic acid a,c-diamide adenosyltransferase [Candidatus Thiodiazotropha endolucinida]